MISRKDRIYSAYPDPVIGYELSPYKSEFSIVIPEATTNLIPNPSFEGGVTTGYFAEGGSSGFAAVATWQAFGSYGLQVSPDVSVESGVYYNSIALTTGLPYTFSVVMQGEAGKIYYIWFSTDAGALIGAKKQYIGTGHKQRIWVTYSETSSASRQFHVTRDARYTDENVFFVDGFMVENKAYPTTYTDGDQKGFVVGEVPYLWTGIAHASTSTRSAQTRSGGREVNLFDLGIRILAIIGLGMMPLVDQSLSIPGYGQLPQGRGTKARDFTLMSQIDAEAGSRQMSAILSTIYDAVKPDLTIKDQPMILRYQQLDDDGDPCGESVDILCKYQNGLEGQKDNHHSRRVGIGFKQYIPFVKSTYDNGNGLEYQLSVANANRIARRSSAGVWSALSTGLSGPVLSLIEGLDGSIFISGGFSNAGDANGDNIVKWDGSAFSSLSTGANASVEAVIVSADGSIYAVGGFTDLGGANGDGIAKWDGSAWSALGTGVSGGGATVHAICIARNGNIYIGGDFALASGVANTARIAMWDGTNWNALGTGIPGTIATGVEAIAEGADGTIYVGGGFTDHVDANGDNITQWDGSAWSSMGTGVNDRVRTIAVGPDGIVYVGGLFTLADAVANTARIASWNGSVWNALGAGGLNGRVNHIYIKGGDLFAGGQFTTAGGIDMPDSGGIWNGSTWRPIDIDFAGTTNVLSFLITRDGTLYIGSDASGTAISSINTTVNNPSSSNVYPTYIFTGPGRLYQTKNYSTNKSIFFNITLLADEVATLTLDPQRPSFISSFRGDIWGTAILPGSNLNYFLIPGNNNISTFINTGTTADTAVTVQFQGLWNSLDAAVWK